MHGVRPKKFLGQHFLKDKNIAKKIVDSLALQGDNEIIVEVGPGTGVLTDFLIQKKFKKLVLIEIDRDAVAYLRKHVTSENVTIVEGNFLKTDLTGITDRELILIGNFPYNISSQILFKVLDHRNIVREVVGMVQKEVGERICADHGNKTYGILSVLIGAYYTAEILFRVPPTVFAPQPKVESAVIRLRRKNESELSCDEMLFIKIVKQGFQNRRKTLRNALKPIFLPLDLTKDKIFDKRAEQLSVDDYINLTQKIQQWKT